MRRAAFPGGPAGAAAEVPAAEALLPFRPGIDGPWDRAAAAHLARRAGFGAPRGLVETLLAGQPAAAAAKLLERQPEDGDVRFTRDTARRLGAVEAAQSSWAYRMLLGANAPLEKLALFWHGHFATSALKVEDAKLMMRQIDLFLERGTGPFLELLAGVARDPAMLAGLDGNLNRRGKPNENFARELFELFALGIGNYSEEDIKEAARAFTGWHVRDQEFWFNERAHDGGVKSVLGKTGPLAGDEVLALSANHPACARFIAAKLFEFYVHPRPGPELREALARAYDACGKRTGEFLVQLFSSRVFFSPRARRAIVATPADYVVGSLRTIGARAGAKAMVRAMREMGQELLVPPNVKGWEMGEAWISSTTLLARYGFAMAVGGWSDFGGLPDLNLTADWPALGDALALLFPEGLPEGTAAEVQAGAKGDPRALVMAGLQLPESQFV